MVKNRFSDLVDVTEMQRITDLFYDATGIRSSIVGLDGTIITASGPQKICTDFHRRNRASERSCLENEASIANQIKSGLELVICECKNGLVDAAAPIKLREEHVANFFAGQFLLKPPHRDYFLTQARRFGFDEVAYMRAVSKIPVIEKVKVRPFLTCFSRFAGMLGETGLRQMELAEAREPLEKYELLAGHSRDIILFIRRSDGRILEANDAALLAYGYSRNELLSLTVYELRVSANRDEIGRQIAEAGKLGLLFETVHRRKDGTTFPVEVSSRGGIVNGEEMLISVIRDISERKWMEEALRKTNGDLERRAEERTSQLSAAYRTLEAEIVERRQAEAAVRETNKLLKLFSLHTSKTGYLDALVRLIQEWSSCECVGVRILDADRNCPYGSVVGFDKEFRESENCLSLDRDECICTRVIRRELVAEDSHYVTPAGSFHCGVTSEIPPRLSPEGKQKYRGKCIREGFESVTVIPVIYGSTVHGAIHLADRKKSKIPAKTVEFIESVQPLIGEAIRRFELEEEQQRLEQQLVQAQKMEALGIAAGGIAHDFNNILAAIIGFAELLRGRIPKGNKEEHFLNRIMEAGTRGRSLIGQMMTFARKGEQEKKPFRLSRTIAQTTQLLRASIPAIVDLRVKIASESGFILGDESRIQQILMNLCSNAAYAMRATGGSLEVELSDFVVTAAKAKSLDMTEGPYMRLSVCDTGEGISPDNISRVFDPFFTTKEQGRGTGLGLSVVHGIVKQHNGYITVESTLGRGTVFTIFFPTARMAASHPDAQKEDDVPTGHESVLFVDDEELLVEMGEELLRDLGYTVTAEKSSVKAFELFKTDPARFDIVITDQMMPEMTGMELAKAILTVRNDLPLILLTGFSTATDPEITKAFGIKALASKPLTKREIAKTIRTVLDG